ncbi:restriction endonuclease fold toxin-2 domain-containing protein [Streptomyces sp. NPDC054783]
MKGTTQLLSTADRKAFVTWVNTLRPTGFGGRPDVTAPANVYQLRTAGYPERLIPLPADARKGAIAADGMRPDDGYMVDAKYVKGTPAARSGPGDRAPTDHTQDGACLRRRPRRASGSRPAGASGLPADPGRLR